MVAAQQPTTAACGLGEDEDERDWMAALRRCIKLYLTAAMQSNSLEQLDAAASYLETEKHSLWHTKPWSEVASDLTLAARGLHVRSLMQQLNTLAAARLPASTVMDTDTDVPSTAPQLQIGSEVVLSPKHLSVLASASALYWDHVVDRLPGSNTLSSLADAVAMSQHLVAINHNDLTELAVLSEEALSKFVTWHLKVSNSAAILHKECYSWYVSDALSISVS